MLPPGGAAPVADLNQDGRFDSRDLNMAADMIGMGLRSPSVDYDGNGVVDTRDWAALLAIVELQGPRATRIVFDLNGDTVIDRRDWQDMTRVVSASINGVRANLRYDLTGDGKVTVQDRAKFLHFLRSSNASVIFDVDGDAAFTSTDLLIVARDVDQTRAGYRVDLRSDVNGDGVVDGRDWQEILSYARRTNEKTVYDVAGTDRTLTAQDTDDIAASIAAVDTGFRQSVRYDFTGDGRIDRSDWVDYVHYVTDAVRRPELLLDINHNGSVDGADASMLGMMIQGGDFQTRLDLNGDGAVNSADVEYLRRYQPTAPVLFPSPWAADVTHDGCITQADLDRISGPWFGSYRSAANFDPEFDVTIDGRIDQSDLDFVRFNPFWNQCAR